MEFTVEKTPRAELDLRVGALQGYMASQEIGGALIAQNADLFYFTGTVPQGWLYIPVSGKPFLFVRKNISRVIGETELEQVLPARSPKEMASLLSDHGYGSPKRLGMELDVLPVSQYMRFEAALKPAGVIDISPAIQAVRAIKSEYEIAIIRDAAMLADTMVATARRILREGMTEVELAAGIEAGARVKGHPGHVRLRTFNAEMYWGPVVSGPDAAEPAFVDTTKGGRGTSLGLPAGAGFRIIRQGDPVIVDMASCLRGYNADITRTLCLGKLAEKLYRAFRVSVEILEVMESMIRPGVTTAEMVVEAEKAAARNGLADHFMGYGNEKAGFCGHGIGIELDEIPIFSRNGKGILEPGSAFALEPMFTFPGEGVVGVEDSYVVTKGGFEKLTKSTYVVEIRG
jgi:Xaa-Pro dipeptidase